MKIFATTVAKVAKEALSDDNASRIVGGYSITGTISVPFSKPGRVSTYGLDGDG